MRELRPKYGIAYAPLRDGSGDFPRRAREDRHSRFPGRTDGKLCSTAQPVTADTWTERRALLTGKAQSEVGDSHGPAVLAAVPPAGGGDAAAQGRAAGHRGR